MFELLFGLFFLIVSAITLVPLFLSDALSGLFGLIFLIFPIFGFIFFFIGLVKVIRNIKTAAKGEECYASILDVFATNKSINGAPIMRATFKVYIESIHQVIEVEEDIGILAYKYPVGSYVIVKYYNNDVNVISHIEEQEVPSYALSYIKVDKPAVSDIIEIDGVKYKRIEE